MAGRVQEVADRVWVLHHAWFELNTTVVAGDLGAVVVDTRGSAVAAHELVDEVRRVLGRRRVLALVNTHEHFDHCFGNTTLLEELGPVPVHAHEEAARRTARSGETYKALYRAHPDEPHRDDVLATTVTPADTTFATRARIDLGDRVVELSHHGRGHTGGDAVATVTGSPVLVAGDLVEESGPPATGDDSYPLEWAATLERVLAAVPQDAVVVPGHGRVVDLAFARAQQEELAEVGRTLRRLAAEGVRAVDAVSAASWPWPEDAVRAAVNRGYEHLGRPGA